MENVTYITNSGNKFEAEDLKDCPFCGNKPELTFKGNDFTKTRSVTIKCKSCRIQRTDAAIRHDHEWCAKNAIQHWNERKDNVSTTESNAILPDVSGTLPEFLYKEGDNILIGWHGDSVVTDEWKEWKEGNGH